MSTIAIYPHIEIQSFAPHTDRYELQTFVKIKDCFILHRYFFINEKPIIEAIKFFRSEVKLTQDNWIKPTEEEYNNIFEIEYAEFKIPFKSYWTAAELEREYRFNLGL